MANRERRGEGDGPAKTLKVKTDQKLGDVVTDAKGWTLYRFDDDTASPSQSNCAGDCEKMWPPVPAKDAKAAEGVTKSDIGKVKRSDGTWQLTLGGWPVYRYAKDTAPGDTKGHGVKGTWNALAPDGNKADRRTPRSSAPSTTPSWARSSRTARAVRSTASTRTRPGR